MNIIAGLALKVAAAATKVATAVVGWVVGSGASTPSLDLQFDATQMFTYTNVITNSLMVSLLVSALFICSRTHSLEDSKMSLLHRRGVNLLSGFLFMRFL